MAQHPIELILARQLASCLAVPMVVVDPDGALLFYNEPAEILLGVRFDEIGELPLGEWTKLVVPLDEAGEPDPNRSRPLMTAVRDGRPNHGVLRMRVADGTVRDIGLTAIPIDGQSGHRLGSLALLWEEAR